MNNRLLKIIILVSAAFGLVSYVASFLSDFPYLLSWAIVAGIIFVLTSVYFLVKTGNFIRSKQFKFIRPAIGVAVVGALFKVMHWPFSSILLLLGVGIVLFAYGWYAFAHKPLKIHALKLLFLLTFVGGSVLSVLRFLFGKEILIGSIVLLLLIVVPALRKVE